MNFQALQMLTIKGLITLNDEIIYFQDATLNKTRISQYFGFRNYTLSVINFTSDIQSAYENSVYNLLGTSSDFLYDKINQKLDTVLQIPQPSGKGTIGTRLLSLMLIYSTDFNLMVNLKLNNTVLLNSYSDKVNSAQNVSSFSQTID